MDNSFFAYLQQLEMLAFFSGYPLLYAVTLFIAGNKHWKNNYKNKLISLLPFAYALIGILYLGLQLKNLHPDYSFKNITASYQYPYLTVWGLLSIFFLFPALNKKPVLSLLHSLVFFFFLAKDLFLHLTHSSTNKEVIKNDMNIYSNSLLLNLGAFAFIVFISFVFTCFKKNTDS
jgi:hypothetical protein